MGGSKVACPENEGLAAFLLKTWQDLAQSAKGIADNMDMTLSKAYSNICYCSSPIRTLRDLSQITGVGKYILKQMQGFFADDSLPKNNLANEGKRNKGPKRYMPQKNSVAYALLITLFRGSEKGDGFMHKKELIDAAETSGLSRVPIMPEKGKGKAGRFESSSRDWYTGWSCMKTLISRGLVVKSSCPAKYMLTEEGKEVACECLMRSGLSSPDRHFNSGEWRSSIEPEEEERVRTQEDITDVEFVDSDLVENVAPIKLLQEKMPTDMPPQYLDKFVSMGFSQQKIIQAFGEVIATSKNKDLSSLWPTILCRLREYEIYGSNAVAKSVPDQSGFTASNRDLNAAASHKKFTQTHDVGRSYCSLKTCSSRDNAASNLGSSKSEYKTNALAMPPLTPGEKFSDVYDVILILDDREQFATQGSRSRKIIENICSQFQIQIEVRRLSLGDGVWIARHKYLGTEYVLDFIVERKKVADLRHSIKDNRYREQKMRLQRCGLKKLIYLVEGDPNSCEAADSIKTACFTTEILEGFDVQRTSGLGDTLKKYGYLTQSIQLYYGGVDPEEKSTGSCLSFGDFIKMCQELDKMTVSDVFAVQLMQVPQVTEEMAVAVLEMYPTVFALGRAYCGLDGDVCAQEEMLKRQTNNFINGSASKNIFQLVWGSS